MIPSALPVEMRLVCRGSGRGRELLGSWAPSRLSVRGQHQWLLTQPAPHAFKDVEMKKLAYVLFWFGCGVVSVFVLWVCYLLCVLRLPQ